MVCWLKMPEWSQATRTVKLADRLSDIWQTVMVQIGPSENDNIGQYCGLEAFDCMAAGEWAGKVES